MAVLPGDPRDVTDDVLAQWVSALIEQRTPEADNLDYKQALEPLGSAKKPKLELAKDVSSFANQYGGVLLYGVPEDRRTASPFRDRFQSAA